MIDTKTIFRNLLINSAPLIALVPADWIKGAWPTSFANLPLIAFREIDNYISDTDYYDDRAISETSVMEVDVFQKPNTSVLPICQALDNALIPALWNRDYSEDFVEKDTGFIHKVLRYSTRLTVS